MSESLAIIGISCLFPKADDLQTYWRNIKHGVDAITPIPASHWSAADYFNADPKAPDQTYAQRGGFLSPVSFNPMEFGIAPKDVEATDTTQLLGLVAAKQALADAGYAEKPFPRERTSVILGVTGALELVIPLGARLGHPIWRRALKEAGVAEPMAEDVVQRISDSYVGWQENSFPGLLGNVAAGRIANRLNLGGTNCVVDAACASSMAALHLAALELSSGRSDMVITGGIDTFNDIFMYVCFSKTPALSPSGDAKPFDRDCDGTILGEGLGMLVLKRLSDAERDGDRIYAVIKGLGTSSDGRGNAIYAPRADGQKEALRRAYADAGVTAESIELVEAHGTGTKVGDTTELDSLTEVFRAARPEGSWAALGSVKSQIGHTKAAAGVAGVIKTALALQQKVLPPTIKVSQPIDEAAPGRSPFYVNTQKRPWLPRAAHPRRAGVSAFGFGGTNFHCVLEEHGGRMTKPGWDGDVEILAFSADSRAELKSQLAGFPAAASWSEVRNRAARSRTEFRPTAEFRLLLPVSQGSALPALREAAIKMLEQHSDKADWVLPNGIAFGSGPRRGKLGALFPGQGSQYVGMFRDLACQFPGMIDALAAANAVFGGERPELGQERLSDFIYPHPAFSEEARRGQEEALKATDIAQPALGAAGLGALSVLGYFGVTAEAAAGHSYGELLALCGAGRLKPEALHRLSNVRGRLMANRNGPKDRGAMLAVQASEATVNSFVGEVDCTLVIANRNSPSQFVLAGSTTQIERASGELTKRSLRAKVLPVSAAFHSTLVADARAPFAAALEEIPFSRGHIPVYANSTAKAYPTGARQARELLASQIVQPVDFMAQIETMLADGVTTFVEMGPGHVLSDLVQAIAQGRDVATVALDASKGARSGTFDLAIALCRLAALGHAVELSRWEDTAATPPPMTDAKPGFTLALTGANHRNPRAPRPPRVTAEVPTPQPSSAIPDLRGSVVDERRPQERPESRMSPRPDPTPSQLPASTPTRPVPSPLPSDLADALHIAQQGMLSLQKMQEQTAQLHRQFLEGQDAARRTLEALLTQRSDLVNSPTQPTPRPTPPLPSTPPNVRGTRLSEPQPSPQHPPASRTPTPVPPPVAPPVAPRASTSGRFDSRQAAHALLEVVAEKTGYPAEMLNLEMGLDSDLGIDSIKRVEIMAALRSRLPGSPEIKPEHPGTLQTLQQVVDFLTSGPGNAASGDTAYNRTGNAASGDTAYSGTGVEPVGLVPSPGAPSPKGTVNPANASAALLEVVAEKTGYPVEMLNLSMGLDSDLGIDSIKRVEIMAALRSRLPGSPEIKPEHLGTLQTLQQVVDFLTSGTGDAASGDAADSGAGVEPVGLVSSPGAPRPKGAVDPTRASAALLEVVAEKTGYPVEMLNLTMGLDSDLGIDSIKRVEIMAALRTQLPGSPEIKPEHLGTLQTLQQIVDFLAAPSAEPAMAPATVIPQSRLPNPTPLQRQVVKSVRIADSETQPAIHLPRGAQVWVTEDGSDLAPAVEAQLTARGYSVRRGTAAALIHDPRGETPAGLVILWPVLGDDDATMKDAFRLIQLAGPSLRQAGGILATASRLDGTFGFGTLNGNGNPVSGGLAGLVKTAAREWPEVHCKAIDLNPEVGITANDADRLIAEIFRQGPVEVGLSGTARFGLLLETAAPITTGAEPIFQAGDVVIVTGGARGITATTALELARGQRLQFVLLGRSRLEESEPEWLAKLADESEIRRILLARANGSSSPKQLAGQLRDILAQREIRECLRQIRATGATAHYRSVDVRRAAEVDRTCAEIRQQLGPIRGLIHGAGVLADRKIEDKTAEQFELVYSTKVSGLRNLLNAMSGDALRLLALFSSYSGRFGRVGQVDYAAANEVLNKIAQSVSRQRPECRVVSFNWGPWNGGMVSDGLRKIFESEGVGLIEPSAGAEFFVREISSRNDGCVEVLALAPWNPPGHERVSDRDSHEAGATTASEPRAQNVAFERDVSVATLPCLASHVLNGRAVLPAALMIEWLGHGAVHGNPGMAFHGFENFKVLKGVVLEPSGSVHVSVLADSGQRAGGLLRVPVQLVSRNGARQVLHARADVLLAEVLPAAPLDAPLPQSSSGNGSLNGSSHEPAPVYGTGNLFHGLDFQGIERLETCSATEVAALVKSAPAPNHWIQNPLRTRWLSDPLALDSSFQMMILWSWKHHEAGSLPCAIRRFRQFVPAFPKNGSRVVIQIANTATPVVTADLYFFDRQGRLLALAEGYECVMDQGLRGAFRQNRLPHGA